MVKNKVDFGDFYKLYVNYMKMVLDQFLAYFNAVSSIFVLGLFFIGFGEIFSAPLFAILFTVSSLLIFSISLILSHNKTGIYFPKVKSKGFLFHPPYVIYT